MADRYLQSRAETRDTQRRALEQMAEGLRGDLGQLTDEVRGDLMQLAAAQAGIYHQLNQHGETLAGVAADMRAGRLAADELDARLTRIETRMQRILIALLAGLILLVIFAASVIAVFATLHLRQPVHGS